TLLNNPEKLPRLVDAIEAGSPPSPSENFIRTRLEPEATSAYQVSLSLINSIAAAFVSPKLPRCSTVGMDERSDPKSSLNKPPEACLTTKPKNWVADSFIILMASNV